MLLSDHSFGARGYQACILLGSGCPSSLKMSGLIYKFERSWGCEGGWGGYFSLKLVASKWPRQWRCACLPQRPRAPRSADYSPIPSDQTPLKEAPVASLKIRASKPDDLRLGNSCYLPQTILFPSLRSSLASATGHITAASYLSPCYFNRCSGHPSTDAEDVNGNAKVRASLSP